jgi:flavin reductase (DIM6/NTAB) family NADH-FMN oxidoreductase RutF
MTELQTSSETFHYYDAEKHHGLAHDPIKAIVGPRAIGWISTIDAEGRVNLAPYSFFAMFASTPQIIGFSSEGLKDSARNASQSGEFVWNLAVRPLAEKMNLTSGLYPPEVDEMALAGLTPARCFRVAPPRVEESPASLECKVVDVVQLKGLHGPMDNYLTLGQVVGVHINTRFIRDGLYDTAAAQPILRAGYRGDYATVGEMFEMIRP